MFTNIFFLILVILLIGFVPEVVAERSEGTLTIGLTTYLALLGIIFLQNRLFTKITRWHLSKMLSLTNLELLGFLCFFYFILYAHASFPHSMTLLAIISIALYFVGLGVHHMSTYFLQSHVIREEYTTPLSYAAMQIGFLVPFVIPLTLLSLIIDIGTLFPQDATWAGIVLTVLSILSIILLMIFFPVALRYFWKCETIQDEALKNRLEAFCKTLHFKHAGIITWSIMKHALTAGIIGLVPRYRYIMFTDRILRELPPESLEAILAHEIAHSKLKHLIYYPFIIMGMTIVAAFAFEWMGDSISDPIVAYVFYAFIAVLYFRIVFGYFSRLFERQADLYIFEAGVPHYYMLQALDYIGVAAGNIHNVPSWHHYGIQQRINFLCDAAIDPTLITNHNQWVKWSLIAYFIIFSVSTIYLIGVQ